MFDVPAPDLFGGVVFEPRLGDRSLFPGLQALVYANHAAMSPASLPVRQALKIYGADFGRRGLDAFPTWYVQRRRLKERLATLLGASADNFAIVQSTTAGIIAIAQCFEWSKGDRIVLFEGEFPANVTPWQRAAVQADLQIDMLSADLFRTDPDAAFARLDDVLAASPRLLAVSLVQFQTGFRMPIQEIAARAHAKGTMICVDAVQGCGIVECDVESLNIDFLSCGSHKWLMGLEGVGFVYARPSALDCLRPALAGWLSHEEPVEFLMKGAGHLRYDRPIRRDIDFLEAGNINGAGCAAIEASLSLIQELGRAKIYGHVQAFHDAVEGGLQEAGFESLRSADLDRRSGILSLLPPPNVDVVKLGQGAQQLGVACTIPDGKLRLSPHWPNSLDEAEQVVLSITTAAARICAGKPVLEEQSDW